MSDIDGNDAMAAIPTFVLVHGAFQDATVWTAVIAEQEAAGHTATAVTLPGHRPDTTLPGQVTLANHRDAVLDVVRQQICPVRLVGHSFGGIIISEVAEAEPALIEELVYVAAYVPEDQFTRIFCDDVQRSVVLASRNDEPLGPLNEPSSVTDTRFGSVAKRYIATDGTAP